MILHWDRVIAAVIAEPSPLHGVHARELDLGGSCKWASTVHLPFCFLGHKYAREANKTVRREWAREKEKGKHAEKRNPARREEKEEEPVEGDSATSYFLFVHAESACRRYRSRPSSPGGRVRTRLRLTVHRVDAVHFSIHEVRTCGRGPFVACTLNRRNMYRKAMAGITTANAAANAQQKKPFIMHRCGDGSDDCISRICVSRRYAQRRNAGGRASKWELHAARLITKGALSRSPRRPVSVTLPTSLESSMSHTDTKYNMKYRHNVYIVPLKYIHFE